MTLLCNYLRMERGEIESFNSISSFPPLAATPEIKCNNLEVCVTQGEY